MEKLKQQAKAYKYQIIVALLAIAFIVFYNWNNNKLQELQGEYNILEKQYTAQKENVILLEEYRKNSDGNFTGVFLSTAHPAKFIDLVEETLGKPIEIPERLKVLLSIEKSSIKLNPVYSDFKALFFSKLG